MMNEQVTMDVLNRIIDVLRVGGHTYTEIAEYFDADVWVIRVLDKNGV